MKFIPKQLLFFWRRRKTATSCCIFGDGERLWKWALAGALHSKLVLAGTPCHGGDHEKPQVMSQIGRKQNIKRKE